MTILRIDSSANTETSITRQMTDTIISQLGDSRIITRDLDAKPLSQITQEWARAREVPAPDRTEAQNMILAQSDTLIAELQEADTIVIGVPVYNFSVPAALKLWIDLVARQSETFRYTENGPEGLLTGKRAILAVASGGTPVGSDWDFASTYMRHFLGFIGITDVTVIAADALAKDPEGTIARANAEITALPKAA